MRHKKTKKKENGRGKTLRSVCQSARSRFYYYENIKILAINLTD